MLAPSLGGVKRHRTGGGHADDEEDEEPGGDECAQLP
jgi:hypothetical protein